MTLCVEQAAAIHFFFLGGGTGRIGLVRHDPRRRSSIQTCCANRVSAVLDQPSVEIVRVERSKAW